MPFKDPIKRKEMARIYRKRYLSKKEKLKIQNLATARWKRNNPTATELQRRRTYLKKHYGITLEQYEEMLHRFEKTCWVCRKPQEDFVKYLNVDHDHVTGDVRGLLCYSCNRNLISRHRDPALLRAAAEYLEGPFTGHVVPEKYLKGVQRKRKKKKT